MKQESTSFFNQFAFKLLKQINKQTKQKANLLDLSNLEGKEKETYRKRSRKLTI